MFEGFWFHNSVEDLKQRVLDGTFAGPPCVGPKKSVRGYLGSLKNSV